MSHILASGGILPTAPASAVEPGQRSARSRGVRQGAMLFLSGVVIVPLLGVLDSFSQSSAFMDMLPGLAAIICFIGGIVRLLFALIFEQGVPRTVVGLSPSYAPPGLSGYPGVQARTPATLPPAQADPVPIWTPRAQAPEFAHPFSVTENTTKILERNSKADNTE